jgi:DNA-binding MarR family transcriptional regulator
VTEKISLPTLTATPDGRRPDPPIGQLLRRAYAFAKKQSVASLRGVGDLTPMQASALVALDQKPLSQAELGRWIDMQPANVHGFARRLEASGLATIVQCPEDGRRSSIVLTTEGHRIATIVRENLRRSSARTLARLDEEEQRTLLLLLAKLLA